MAISAVKSKPAIEKTASVQKAQAPAKAQPAPPQPAPAKQAASAPAPLYTPSGKLEGATSSGFIAGKGDVVVDILSSDSGYENRIYWSADNFATRHYLGIDNHTGTVNLGSFAPGTRIEFGIVNGLNEFYRSGPASSNADGFQHAKAQSTASGMRIGFEDLAGGGDRDFNDVIVAVRNAPVAEPPRAEAAAKAGKKEKAAKKAKSQSGNRSGLGDGTNPGQGAGRANATNQGTENPNNAAAVAAASHEATVKKVAQAYAVGAAPAKSVKAKKK